MVHIPLVLDPGKQEDISNRDHLWRDVLLELLALHRDLRIALSRHRVAREFRTTVRPFYHLGRDLSHAQHRVTHRDGAPLVPTRIASAVPCPRAEKSDLLVEKEIRKSERMKMRFFISRLNTLFFRKRDFMGIYTFKKVRHFSCCGTGTSSQNSRRLSGFRS